jgi:hypothetical protein
MAYGILKCDTITFTDAGVDKSVTISGLVQNPTFTGNVTATGTISGDIVRGQTISGVTVTGTTAQFTSGTFVSLTGTTTSGTTANFVSGVFTTQISGATVTGGNANFTSGTFTNISGGVYTITSGVFALGTSGTPSISFASDPNTGIYSPGADQVAISTSGTGRLIVGSTGTVNIVGAGTAGSTQAVSFNGSAPVDSLVILSDGKVGLGTSAPDERLVVAGAIRATSNATDWSASNGALIDYNAGEMRIVATRNGANSSNMSFTTFNAGTAGTRMYITSAGNVGIGTISPTLKLSVDGDTWFGNGSGVEIGRLFNDAGVLHLRASNNVTGLALGTAGGEKARIDSSGRLLVGTFSARTNFNNSSLAPRLQVEGTDASTGGLSVVRNENSNGPIIFLGSSGGSTLGSNTLIANDTNSSTFGAIFFSGSDGTEFVTAASISSFLDGTPGANDMPGRLVFSTTADGASSPTPRMTIKNDGSVIWGDVFGDTVGATNRDLYIDDTGLMGYVSSIKASKANINAIESTDWLYQLKPVSFNRRKKDKDENYTEDTYDELEYGLIAEEVEIVAPELCFYDYVNGNPELRGVHYTQLITPMLKALQEAAARIETLEAVVAALKTS